MDNFFGTKTCKIRITSKHYVHDAARFERYGITPSLFGENDSIPDEKFTDPEDFPDEMSDALDEILHMEHEKHGSPETVNDPYAPPDEDDDDDGDDDDFPNGDPLSAVERLNRNLELLMKMIADGDDGDDDDALVFETAGCVEKCIRDGKAVTEIRYTEDESMDGTETVIRIDDSSPHCVAITHSGGVISTLICEEGVRHITVYKTPIMPFEIAVYTKKCRTDITSCGGIIELDYILELRGADLQRTVMTIEYGLFS